MTFNLYFIYGSKVGNKWFIAKRGYGYSENGWEVERKGWKVTVKRKKKVV